MSVEGDEDRIVPVARCIYTSRDADSGVRREYFSSFRVRHSEMYKWKVHIGDVVAVAMSNHTGKDGRLSLGDIEKWQPDHLVRASPHWKVGLVVALVQVIDPQHAKVFNECHVEWLEKALDTPFAREKKLRDFFRPWQKNSPICKFPHLLLRSYRYAAIDPANLLPVQITMLSQQEFKDGWAWDPENRFVLQMHCPKFIEYMQEDRQISHQNDGACMDAWPSLNHRAFSKGNSARHSAIPPPLVKSWAQWQPVLDDDDLLTFLMQGFLDSAESKAEEYLKFKNRQIKEQNVLQEEKERLQQEAQAKKNATRAAAAKRSVAKDSTHPNSKRVRIETPEERTEAPASRSKAAGVKAKKQVVRPIIKKTPKTKTWLDEETPTSSTKATLSPGDILQNPRLSKQQRTMKIDAPIETSIHRSKHKNYIRQYYERVDLIMEQEAHPRTVMIGDIVAVVVEEDYSSTASCEPFGCPWGVAQVLALYYTKESGKWHMQVRRLLRYHELPESTLERLKQKKRNGLLDQHKGLLETAQVGTFPIQAILPVKVVVKSTLPDGELLKMSSDLDSMRDDDDDDNLPTLEFQCRHFQNEEGGPIAIIKNDWDNFTPSSNKIRGPMERAFDCLQVHPRVVEKSIAEIESRICDSDVDDDESSMQESAPSLQISPAGSRPIFESWGVKFHDGVRIDIDPRALKLPFTPKTKQWTIKVGYIVPVACEDDSDFAIPSSKKNARWFPFVCNWSPAQIVSIYENEQGRWRMQVRWFHRFDELLERQKSGLGDLNKPHVVFESEMYNDLDVECCLPGRVVLSSSVCDNWEVAASNLSGLPLIPRFCSHICLDEEIDESPDWTGYDIRLHSCPKPLMRGLLLDPRNRTKKEWVLMMSRYYSKHISLRQPDPEEALLSRWVGNGGPDLQLFKSDSIDFDENKVKAEFGNKWELEMHGNHLKQSFYGTLELTVPPEYIAAAPRAVRKARHLKFTVSVGDIVAYYEKAACPKSDHILMKQLRLPWFPFRVPWSFGQVLAIYSDADSSQVPMVEIRRLYRNSEIPQDLRAFVPLSDDAEREEIFESKDVLASVPASRVLGSSEVFLGRHKRPSKASHGSSVTLSCRCKYFFDSVHGRFLPIFSSSLVSETWWDRFVSRGIALSSTIKIFKGLEQLTNAHSNKCSAIDVRNLLGGTSINEAGAIGKSVVAKETKQHFFSRAAVSPSWNDMVDSDLHFHKDERGQIMWEFKVGDLLAVKDKNAPANGEHASVFPFRCPWTPCQLLAIYSDGATTPDALHFEVRFFEPNEGGSNGSEMQLGRDRAVAVVSSADLLGPVKFVSRGARAISDWDKTSRILPSAIFFGSEPPLPGATEMMQLSSSYTEEAAETILKMMGTTTSSSSTEASSGLDDGAEECPAAWTIGSPVFVEASKLQTFYNKLRATIQTRLLVHGATENQKNPPTWDFKIGDVVLVHCDGPMRHPLKCNWGVAEIVAIWQQFDSRDELEKSVYSDGGDCDQKLRVEIRWFYERHDLAGLSAAEAKMDSGEVLETDDVCVLEDVTSILGPAKLQPDHNFEEDDDLFMNSSVLNFVCRRFWSTNRKSLIPCGGLEGRVQRGRLYSQSLPKGYSSSVLDLSGMKNLPASTTVPKDWTASVKAIIAKLNLKDASKAASVRGDTLVGRDKEMSQLLSFFRASIRGDPGPGGIRSSMLIAGPPGVGKTQSIHAAIARLYAEQARGELPTFTFVPLNGMEMRHPFEAYVKFWEAVSGRKHVGSHEKACQKLEYHFTNIKAVSSDRNSSVTVVLLDEIDYLVTEKQSVLYNFFDWPKRAASIPDGRRLVVIGVSNTLNLAEQLMPSVQSRLGSERIAFKAYSVTDAAAILKAKIDEASPDVSIFDKDAILFAARKTAAMSGDIRKAFQICRGAAELVLRRVEEEKENEQQQSTQPYPTIRIGDVQKASRDSFDSALLTAVSFATPFQALLLVSLASLCRTTGREVGGFDITDIMTKMESLVGSVGDPQYAPAPSFGETLQLLNRLAETNLITLRTSSSSNTSFRSCAGGSGGAWPMTALAVDEHTIVRGLKNTSHKVLAERSLPSVS